MSRTRNTWRDRWFVARVVGRSPGTAIEMAALQRVVDHADSQIVHQAAFAAVEGTEVPSPVRVAHSASTWATEMEALAQAPRGGIPERHTTSLLVLIQSLRAVEEAAHALAVRATDADAVAEMRVRLARFLLASEPLMKRYARLLRKMHATALAVDPSRIHGTRVPQPRT